LSGDRSDPTKQFSVAVGNMQVSRWVVASPPLKNVAATTDFAHKLWLRFLLSRIQVKQDIPGLRIEGFSRT